MDLHIHCTIHIFRIDHNPYWPIISILRDVLTEIATIIAVYTKEDNNVLDTDFTLVSGAINIRYPIFMGTLHPSDVTDIWRTRPRPLTSVERYVNNFWLRGYIIPYNFVNPIHLWRACLVRSCQAILMTSFDPEIRRGRLLVHNYEYGVNDELRNSVRS